MSGKRASIKLKFNNNTTEHIPFEFVDQRHGNSVYHPIKGKRNIRALYISEDESLILHRNKVSTAEIIDYRKWNSHFEVYLYGIKGNKMVSKGSLVDLYSVDNTSDFVIENVRFKCEYNNGYCKFDYIDGDADHIQIHSSDSSIVSSITTNSELLVLGFKNKPGKLSRVDN